jgi:putative DNA primase/helicase
MELPWRQKPSVDRRDIYRTAVEAHRHGINVLPISGDGSKRPAVKWEVYQHERITLSDLERWFLFTHRYPGLAFVTGAISGGLGLLDFDDEAIYQAWRAQMRQQGMAHLSERIAQGYLEASPSGRHLLYRCRTVDGNRKLAGRLIGATRRTLIETRGEGGLVVVAPSGEGVHPSGKSYRLLQGGAATIQMITAPERQALLKAACALDELSPQIRDRDGGVRQKERSERRREDLKGLRPGDFYNRYASWEEVLAPHGWRLLYMQGDEGYWTKNAHVHATTNYKGSDLLYVFSTSTPFEPERGYSKFAAYTLLNYGGLDEHAFVAAARDLAAQGYSRE